jgi:hypothetical protein
MSIEIESNVVNFPEVQRRAIDRRHATRRHLVEWVIDQTNSDVEHLFGASAAEVARISLIIADLSCDIDDISVSGYLEPLPEIADEELAGFIAAVTGDALKLEHSGDPTFNANKTFDQCLIQARRIVSDPYKAHLFEGRHD